MSLSEAVRIRHIDRVLEYMLGLETEHGFERCFEASECDPVDLPDVPPSIWGDLQSQGLVERSETRYNAFQFTPSGWIVAYRRTGRMTSPDIRRRAARLAAALRKCVGGRNEDDSIEMAVVASTAALPLGWVESALSADLLEQVFPGRHFDVLVYRGRHFVRIERNLGQRRLEL